MSISGWRGWAPLSVGVLTAAVYANSLGNGFHYDDTHAILRNHSVRSLANIPLYFVDSGTFSSEPAMAMYRPLLLVSYAVNYALGGYGPFGYHLLNVILHALCAVAVYAILRGLTASPALGWWGGALFGLHPVHTQAVNYISSRSELMSGLGVLLAVLLVSVRRERLPLAAACYALALLAKSSAVCLLGFLAVLEMMRPLEERRWRRLWPFAAITALYLLAITADGFLPRALAQDVRPWTVHLLTQTKALVYYLKLLALPFPLSVEHAFSTTRGGPLSGAVIGAALFLVTAVAGAVAARRVMPWLTGGVAWLLVGLALTFFLPLNVLVNEHRLYLPSVGFLLVAVAPLNRRSPARFNRGEGEGALGRLPRGWRRLPSPLAIAGCGVVILFGLHTWQRSSVWRDELSLWSDAAARAPAMFRAQGNLGLALYERGELRSARERLEIAVELNPGYSKTWNNLGLVYEGLNLRERAQASFSRALELRPDLAGALNNMGRLALDRGEPLEAQRYLRRALEVNPGYGEARVNLGRAYQQLGEPREAEAAYREAIRLDPTLATAYNNLALLCQEEGRTDEAESLLGQAIEAAPDYAEAQVNLRLLQLERDGGVAPADAYLSILEDHPAQVQLWRALGELRMREQAWSEAVAAYEQALELAPDAAGGYRALASAYRSAGRPRDAIRAYESALATDPDNADLHNSLASAHAAVGELDAARRACRRALEIDPGHRAAAANLARLLASPKPP